MLVTLVVFIRSRPASNPPITCIQVDESTKEFGIRNVAFNRQSKQRCHKEQGKNCKLLFDVAQMGNNF